MPNDQLIGKRVQLSPHLDRWMMGDRYGTVVSRVKKAPTPDGQLIYRVQLDRSGKTIKVYGEDITVIVPLSSWLVYV